ncbi:MAG TPA: hypothetical protein VHO70_24945 [Chitinispirillaceae bacterium]|nr:hypothetical protein [Chitinispirillaceae bacterium]
MRSNYREITGVYHEKGNEWLVMPVEYQEIAVSIQEMYCDI